MNAVGRAVFVAICSGPGGLHVITPPPLPGRDYLDDPIMIAQRRNRKPHAGPRHGPIMRGQIQPIRKAFDWLQRRWVTNQQ